MPALATGAGHEPGLYELLAALPSQLQPHVSRPEDNTFLQDMFGERSLHSLIKIHEWLQHYEERKPVPVLDSATALANELSEELEGKSASGEMQELLQILAKPYVKVVQVSPSDRAASTAARWKESLTASFIMDCHRACLTAARNNSSA